jgi:hypothetical protein
MYDSVNAHMRILIPAAQRPRLQAHYQQSRSSKLQKNDNNIQR